MSDPSPTYLGRKLHKRDNNGRIRLWWMEQSFSQYRTHHGLDGGTITTSGWTTVTKGNQGRTIDQQVHFEVQAAYAHQLARDYFELKENPDIPKVIFPMLAQKLEKKKYTPGYIQPKLDGVRCVATAKGLFSRQGKPIESVPHIMEALKPAFDQDPDLILDGELYNHHLRDEFEELMSLCRKSGKKLTPEILEQTSVMQYHIYDVISLKGPYADRGHAFTDLVFDLDDPAIYAVRTMTLAATYEEAIEEALRLVDVGYEGGIWRDQFGEYEVDHRSAHLRKIVFMDSAEFPFVRLELGNGNWAGIPKSVVCLTEDGREFSAGIKGTREQNLALLDRKIKQVTLNYKGLTGYGIPRCAVAKDWDRDDA